MSGPARAGSNCVLLATVGESDAGSLYRFNHWLRLATFGDLMFAFFTAAVDQRNTMGLRPAADWD